jgi:hypothetical protein
MQNETLGSFSHTHISTCEKTKMLLVEDFKKIIKQFTKKIKTRTLLTHTLFSEKTQIFTLLMI